MSNAKRRRLKNFSPDMLVFANSKQRNAADIFLTAGFLCIGIGYALHFRCDRRFFTRQEETQDGIAKLYEFAANAAGGNI